MNFDDRVFVDLGTRPAQPTMVRGRIAKFVVFPLVQPESRSIPAQIGTTDPAYPIAPSKPVEHPQPISTTEDVTWALSEPVADPTLLR